MTGATIGLALTYLLTPQQLEDFGWRIAFGLGAVVLPFGLFLRRNLPETLHRREAQTAIHPTAYGAFSHARPILLGLGMIMSFTTSTYVLLYMTTYASETLHMTPDGLVRRVGRQRRQRRRVRAARRRVVGSRSAASP